MEAILEGISLSLSVSALTGILVGVVLGQLLGSIPGLTAAMAVALLVPFSFYFDPWVGIPMMLAMFKGSLFGSSMPAILLGTPGTPAAAATVIDGHPLAKSGKGGKAMHTVLYASVFGDAFSDICLILGAGMLASIAIRFGPSEYVILILFALISLVSLNRGSSWKGIVSILLGILISSVGLDPITGTERLTFGNLELFEGIGLIPMLIGFLAISEVFKQLEQPIRNLGEKAISFSSRREDNYLSRAERRALLPTLFRSSAIGTVIGALPGLGSTVAAFIAYNEARRTAKNPEEFGRGSLHGIAAPEAANNAVSGANLIPLLAFGIPGDVAAALILGALLIQGIVPGPLAFRDNPVPIYAIFSAMLLANLVNYVIGIGFIPLAKKMVSVPKRLLFPAVLVFASAGAYAMRGSLFDVQLMFGFGVVGWLMSKFQFPPVLLVIGFILAPILERAARQTLIIVSASDGWLAFITGRPVLMILLAILGILSIAIIRQRMLMNRSAEAQERL